MSEQTVEPLVKNKSFESSQAVNLHRYDISSALQTTLEFDELIKIFGGKIQPIIPHCGVEYSNNEFDLHLKHGEQAPCSCAYVLKVEDTPLGELRLMRQQSFSKEELENLESLLCCLIYPLRNATLFQQALKMAYTDALTKTSNRAAFIDCLQREIRRVNRTLQPLSLIFVDLDDFKSINDKYGHSCGDIVLGAVAGWLTDSVRGSDAVFRYGGEEFVIILFNTDAESARIIAERLRKDIASHTLAYGMEVINITASMGISVLTPSDNAESLIKRADEAMYKAKRLGRNQVCMG